MAILIVSCVSGLAEVVNNYVDRNFDHNQKTKTLYGVILSGGSGIPASALSRIQTLVVSTALIAACLLAVKFLGSQVLLLTLVAIGMAVFYSAPPLILKEKGVWGMLDMALGRGLISFNIGWAACAMPNGQSITLGIFFSLLNFGSATLSHLADYREDCELGVRTFPVCYGFERAAKIAAAGVASSLIILGFVLYPRHAVNILALPLAGFSIIFMRAILKLKPVDDAAKITKLQSAGMLLFLFGLTVFL